MDNSNSLPTVLSLCTGYGGIERGLELAGFEHRVIAHVEIEAFAAANLVAKMETGALVPAPIWTDLKTLPVDCFRDRVELITGGYPCQPFSAAGKRAGKDDPRHLWPWIRDHIQAIRPVQCFFENVEGHISLGLREVIEDLESLGYATTWGIFSAAEVGAPHQRKRVYILADAKSQRYGARREKRDIYQENGRQNGECVPEPAIASTRSGGESQPLANSDSERQPGWFETNGRQARSSVEGSDEPNLANAISEGSQGRLHRRQDKKRQSELRYAGCGSSARQQQGQEIWDFEPGLGRVVDGCADRVDRIRLLGNGVVPQTAAKAWITLNKEMQVKE